MALLACFYKNSLNIAVAHESKLGEIVNVLTDIDIEALLADEELADQVWEAWESGEIDDLTAWFAWLLVASRGGDERKVWREFEPLMRESLLTSILMSLATPVKPNPPKRGDRKPRVLASSEKPRATPRRTPRLSGCHELTLRRTR